MFNIKKLTNDWELISSEKLSNDGRELSSTGKSCGIIFRWRQRWNKECACV